MELKGSKTEANLMAAFAGESQARNKYIFYAKAARRDGFEQIADIFEETAANEQAHAYQWFLHLKGGEVPPTVDALEDAAGGEHLSVRKRPGDVGGGHALIETHRLGVSEHELGNGFGKAARPGFLLGMQGIG